MQVTVKVLRFDPEKDKKAHFQSYELEADPLDRILDVLNTIKWYQDGTLTFRRSCAHGVCGSDAVRINGRNRLACKVLVQDIGKKIQIEPMLGFTIIKDLVVDMEPFFAKYRSIKPYLINYDDAPAAERIQSSEERDVFDETTKCILCGACSGSCPPYWASGDFIGPAAIVNAHRFIFDTRDQGAEDRLAVLGEAEGLFRCRTVFNCTDACPRDIPVTKAIEEIKRYMLYRR
ncbi:MAG: succinate dehydrogenase iron-sulfur subunit [Chloroflexi bacterium]|uniref:Fumarate reductase iron-sulfur subunit n=1 Tax=Candidatus Chlorohelix allophototropha TaxID=3003348 RepID=A0A8T7M7I9_9CHLR|nr:succinate dehydrogenase iron-sulfur subunit [Chloroflexota bacterium]WJW68041.1 succinate dehydrogenase iron-sulfur subunit [Chloroflexota bacterium L227-S17]